MQTKTSYYLNVSLQTTPLYAMTGDDEEDLKTNFRKPT